jgi:micrococcal nuclease
MAASILWSALSAAAATLGVALTACGGAPSGPTSRLAQVETVTVASVHDGDTLRLTDGRRVRVVQIDAPELGPDCFGEQARRALARLVPPGTRVALDRDPALDSTDRYGRLLRYVSVGGRDVGLDLVAAGAAEPYFFHGKRGRHADQLLRAAKRARAAKRGLWAACPAARLDPALGSMTGPA